MDERNRYFCSYHYVCEHNNSMGRFEGFSNDFIFSIEPFGIDTMDEMANILKNAIMQELSLDIEEYTCEVIVLFYKKVAENEN